MRIADLSKLIFGHSHHLTSYIETSNDYDGSIGQFFFFGGDGRDSLGDFFLITQKEGDLFAEGGEEQRDEARKPRAGTGGALSVLFYWVLLNYNHFAGGAGADFDDVNACSGYRNYNMFCGSWQG